MSHYAEMTEYICLETGPLQFFFLKTTEEGKAWLYSVRVWKGK